MSDPSGTHPPGLAALIALVDRLGRSPAAPRTTLPPPLKAVSAHRGTWSRLKAEQRLHAALQQVPAQAGPLNSSQVVLRALQELHRLSPAYLDAFLTHIEALMALEQASGGGATPPPKARR